MHYSGQDSKISWILMPKFEALKISYIGFTCFISDSFLVIHLSRNGSGVSWSIYFNVNEVKPLSWCLMYYRAGAQLIIVEALNATCGSVWTLKEWCDSVVTMLSIAISSSIFPCAVFKFSTSVFSAEKSVSLIFLLSYSAFHHSRLLSTWCFVGKSVKENKVGKKLESLYHYSFHLCKVVDVFHCQNTNTYISG